MATSMDEIDSDVQLVVSLNILKKQLLKSEKAADRTETLLTAERIKPAFRNKKQRI